MEHRCNSKDRVETCDMGGRRPLADLKAAVTQVLSNLNPGNRASQQASVLRNADKQLEVHEEVQEGKGPRYWIRQELKRIQEKGEPCPIRLVQEQHGVLNEEHADPFEQQTLNEWEQHYEQIEKCEDQQELKQFSSQSQPPGCVVHTLYEILQTGPWSGNMVANLREFFETTKIQPYHVNQVLKKIDDVGKAFSFFNWMGSLPEYKHDKFNYSLMMGLLSNHGDVAGARRIFEEIRNAGSKIDTYTGNTLLKCYGRAHKPYDALMLYKKFRTYGAEPDIYTYSMLIVILGRAGHLRDAKEVLLDMRRFGLEPDAFVYNAMMHNYAKWGEVPAAMECYQEMQNLNVPFSTVTYATLMNLFAKDGRNRQAIEFYNEYLKSGLNPDLLVYNTALLVLHKLEHIEEAEWVFQDIFIAGLSPDTTSYYAMINLWAKLGNVAKVKIWFSKLLASRIEPNHGILNAVMHGYLKGCAYSLADELLRSMPLWDTMPSLHTYTQLLMHFTECRKEHADTVRKLMHDTGHPAEDLFDEILNCVIKGKQLQPVAEDAFAELKTENPRWTLGFVDVLVNYLHQFGYLLEAHSVWEAALRSRLYPRGIWEQLGNTWYLWLLNMEVGTALVALTSGLLICKDKMNRGGTAPSKLIIITGLDRCRSLKVTMAVHDTLRLLKSPFKLNSKRARFISGGEEVRFWLGQPEVKAELVFEQPILALEEHYLHINS